MRLPWLLLLYRASARLLDHWLQMELAMREGFFAEDGLWPPDSGSTALLRAI